MQKNEDSWRINRCVLRKRGEVQITREGIECQSNENSNKTQSKGVESINMLCRRLVAHNKNDNTNKSMSQSGITTCLTGALRSRMQYSNVRFSGNLFKVTRVLVKYTKIKAFRTRIWIKSLETSTGVDDRNWK